MRQRISGQRVRLHALMALVAITTATLGISSRVDAQHAAHHGDERASVEAVVRAAFAASERGDLRALDSMYTSNATIIEGAGLDRSWTNYRDHHLAPELAEFREFKYRPSEIEASVNGDLAWVMFRYTLSAKAGERQIDAVGRGTMILERINGAWRIRHSHTSSRARRATDAP